MTITKLALNLFIKPSYLTEIFSMDIHNEDVVKTKLFADMLKYMQAFSQLASQNKLPMDRKAAGTQDFINRLESFKDYFAAKGTQLTMSGFEEPTINPAGTVPTKLNATDAVENNKRSFLVAMSSGQEFVPVVWSKALATSAGQQLPPKFYLDLPKTVPQTPLGMGSRVPMIADNSPAMSGNPIALDTSRDQHFSQMANQEFAKKFGTLTQSDDRRLKGQ